MGNVVITKSASHQMTRNAVNTWKFAM